MVNMSRVDPAQAPEAPTGTDTEIPGSPVPASLDQPVPQKRRWLARVRHSWVAYVMAVPLVVFAAAFFLYPIIRMAVTTLLFNEPSGGFNFNPEPFERIFADEFARDIVWRTIRVAAITTAVDLVIALPLTLWMRQLSPRWRGFLTILMLSPLLMSVVVRTLGWVVMLGPTGFVNQMLSAMGLGSWDVMYSETAIVLGLVQVFLGFMVLSLLTSVLKIPETVIWASFNLGASSWKVLRHVVWPLTMPGIIAGVSIVFPLSAGAYVIPALLGGSRNPTLGTQAYTEAIVQVQFDRGAALSLVLFAIICVVTGGLALATRRNRRALEG